jgi:hypothetical protein
VAVSDVRLERLHDLHRIASWGWPHGGCCSHALS